MKIKVKVLKKEYIRLFGGLVATIEEDNARRFAALGIIKIIEESSKFNAQNENAENMGVGNSTDKNSNPETNMVLPSETVIHETTDLFPDMEELVKLAEE